MNRYQYFFITCFVVVNAIHASTVNAAPTIVVTLKPLHSLIASISDGITKPVLLLNTTQSPHHTTLRPSDYRTISNADIVFWVGSSMETFMPAIKKKYKSKTLFVSLLESDGILRLPARNKYAVHTPDSKHKHQHDSRTSDPHFWLSPKNARQIVNTVTEYLVSIDAVNASTYYSNQTSTLKKIDALNTYLQQLFQNLHSIPFITYHDAYQYFEKEFHLNRLASVSLNEEASPGIRQIRTIRSLINSSDIQCVFYDAPVRPAVINTLIEDSEASAIELDILGINQPPGKSLWFDSIKILGKNIASCLRNG